MPRMPQERTLRKQVWEEKTVSEVNQVDYIDSEEETCNESSKVESDGGAAFLGSVETQIGKPWRTNLKVKGSTSALRLIVELTSPKCLKRSISF